MLKENKTLSGRQWAVLTEVEIKKLDNKNLSQKRREKKEIKEIKLDLPKVEILTLKEQSLLFQRNLRLLVKWEISQSLVKFQRNKKNTISLAKFKKLPKLLLKLKNLEPLISSRT